MRDHDDESGCFRVELRVRYEETDQGGVVYHANYFRYLEVARVELLRSRGFDYAALEREGTRLLVVEGAARYRAPSTFDDRLVIEIQHIRTGAARIVVDYEIRRNPTEDEPGTLVVTAKTTHACVDLDGRPRRLPGSLREALRWTR